MVPQFLCGRVSVCDRSSPPLVFVILQDPACTSRLSSDELHSEQRLASIRQHPLPPPGLEAEGCCRSEAGAPISAHWLKEERGRGRVPPPTASNSPRFLAQ